MDQSKGSWSASILYALAWLVCSLFVIIDVLVVREATLDVMTAIQANRIEASAEGEKVKTQIEAGFVKGAIDQGMLFVGGIVAVVLAIAIEYYFRIGQQKGVLLKRILWVLGIQIGVFIVCVAIQTIV